MKRQSRLDAPVRYWDEDLPKQADDQKAPPQLIRVNEINDVWMEIPRYVNHGWGGQWFSSITALFCLPFCFLFLSLPDFVINIPIVLLLFILLAEFGLLFFCIFGFRSFYLNPGAHLFVLTASGRKSMYMNISAASGPGSAGGW
ncbi:hypothetical protein D6D38_23400 [Rahnella variigena]|uniref:hypothetical protein n=1 Tax=Rahnella variigena TaxID=574964 RepID=UPI000E74D891|nr:hypothetical protein [Rahnella variigena]RJT49541.1 hypothetical protein D6D38_23400 [Rahnella variigena]